MIHQAQALPDVAFRASRNLEAVPDFSYGKHDRLWSIILAGGRGERISSFVRQWKGRQIPKQYCAFVGTRSMLQHTLDRAIALGERDHQFAVIDRTHQGDAADQLADFPQHNVILQPSNRGTLPGIFLPLTYVYARDAESVVAIYPSDHFVYPERGFLAWIERAVDAAEVLSDRLLLIGAQAEGPEPDYGWIAPGEELWRHGTYAIRAVNGFLEKPSAEEARFLMASGCLWNTMIMVAGTRALWRLGSKLYPDTMKLFEQLRNAIGTSREKAVLQAIYRVMPENNFSADLLTHATGLTAVLPMEGVLWSDWGRAERIAETLCSIGKPPNFPKSILNVH